MNLLKLRYLGLLLLIFCSFNSSATVILEKYKDTNEVTIKIEKRIVEKDLQDFKDALQTIDNDKSVLHMNAVQLNSAGGNMLIAQEIGKLLRARKLNTYVAKDDLCASACVDVLISGIMRYPFGDVKVHRTSYASELNKNDNIETDVEKWKQLSAAYISSMGVSDMLRDATQSTPNWQIRTLKDSEKSQWQLLGIDQLSEETMFTQIANERFISRREFIDIYKSNYEDCLKKAADFKMTTMECAKSMKVKPITPFKHWITQYEEWIDKNIPHTTYLKSHTQEVQELREKMQSGKLYQRHMKIQSLKDAVSQSSDKRLQPLSKDDVKKIEAKSEWWIQENNVHILLSNPSDLDIKKLTFSFSTTDCLHQGKKLYIDLDLMVPLDRYRSVVYRGLLPFDYLKEIGKGEKCGIVEEAFLHVK